MSKSKQIENIKATELIADDKNFNKGSDTGAEMIRKSFQKFGAGRSILIDKNNRVIAGNKSVEYSGIDDVLVVESDGSIYRASGFHLVDIKKNTSMWRMPNGDVVCGLVFNPGFSPNNKNDQSKKYGKVGEMATWPATRFLNYIGAKPIPGYQLKYVYFLNESAKKRLTVPILPFSKIDEMGAGMYKGQKITLAERHTRADGLNKSRGTSSVEMAVTPTSALNN